MIRKIIFLFAVLVGLVLIFTAGSIIAFRTARRMDFRRQEAHLEELRRDGGAATAAGDSDDLTLDDDLPINRIRYLATHNSYRLKAGALAFFFLDLGEPGESRNLQYSHLPLTDQLELGVRSFELDIRYRKGGFENCHVPLVDNRSHTPDLILALEELRIWSDRHPGHVPLIVLMETKSDWMILDPALDSWKADVLLQLDAAITAILGDRIIGVRDVGSGGAWPTLGEARGGFLFVHHGGEAFTGKYMEAPRRISFVMKTGVGTESGFRLGNDPFDEGIPGLVDHGFIVRTRADADSLVIPERQRAALDSGAQIVSTDFPKGYPGTGDDALDWKTLRNHKVPSK